MNGLVGRAKNLRPLHRLVVAATVLLALAVLAFVDPAGAARGWLIGFVFVSGLAAGALALLLTHRLTGGRWGHAAGPALRTAAGFMPWVCVAFVPVLLGIGAIYPWVADPQTAGPGVASLYLNVPGFVLRGLVALAGWAMLAMLLLRGRCSPLLAGVGLVFYAVMVSLTAVDWILSVEPHYSSSAFGAEIAVQQIASALAFAAVVAPMGEARTRSDVGALLLTAVLGTLYIGFMSFLIVWYGNLPSKAAWYLRRISGGWEWLIFAAVLFGAVAPLMTLMVGRLRRDRTALRLAGVAVLIGVFCHAIWMLAPGAGPWVPICALLAVLVMAIVAPIPVPRLGQSSHEAAHG